MVLVKDKCNNILDPLSAVSGIIERRHTLPILSNVLIERTTQALSFLATDIEIQITARSTLMAGGDPRAVTVGARKLVDILRALPEDTEVTLQQQDKRLLVKAGKSRFTLQTLPAEDFPRLARPAEEAAIELSTTQAAFSFGTVEVVSKLVDGKFPDYTRVIPTQHKNRLQTEREPLRQALQRAAILSNEKFRGVRWVLTEGSLKLVSSNAEQEEAQEDLDVRYSGDALDIGFNVNYLLDVLNNVPGSAVECAFGDSSSSALISYASEQDFKYVVMPMRI